jgi:hypothetical protein
MRKAGTPAIDFPQVVAMLFDRLFDRLGMRSARRQGE